MERIEKITVRLGSEQKTLTFKEPTGEDQLKYFQFVSDIAKSDSSEFLGYIKLQNDFVSQLTGLSSEEVGKLELVDKQKLLDIINERMFSFLPKPLMSSSSKS